VFLDVKHAAAIPRIGFDTVGPGDVVAKVGGVLVAFDEDVFVIFDKKFHIFPVQGSNSSSVWERIS